MTNNIEKLTEKIIKNPSAELYFQRATLYYNVDKYDLAIQDCDKGLNLDKKHAGCYYRRMATLSQLKRSSEAIEECNQSIKLDPAYAPAYLGRGTAYYYQTRFNEALADYAKAIELAPDWVYSYYNRGHIYFAQNRYDEALLDYSKVVKLAPDWDYAYRNLGILYYELNRYDEALANYKKAYELFNDDNEYYKSILKNRIDKIIVLIESREAQKDDVRKIIDETNKFRNEIDKNKESQSSFFSHKHEITSIDNLEFTVLRKWNSFTPIVGNGFRASKGGGYFIKSGGKGIVIDPGFNFIENFMADGHKFKEIDAVLITHAHNDHTSDLDSLLTILHKYNDDLFGSDSDEKEDSIYDEVLKNFSYSRDDLKRSPDKKKEVEDEVNKIFKERRKVITFYITTGIFKKYAGFFNLMKISNYKIVCVDAENFTRFNIDDIDIRVIKAKHHDIISDATAVGFCFIRKDFALIYTGDTGFWGMDGEYRKLRSIFSRKRVKHIVLVANLGGFKKSEDSYSKVNDIEDHYYKNHLGRLGTAKLVEIIKPEICVISEFGEEFNGYRIEIAKVFNKVYAQNLPKTKFLPADIGLCINSDTKVRAITNAVPKNPPDKFTDKDGFPCEFIRPANVHFDEVEQISELYYYSNDVDAKALAKKKVAIFYESLK